MKQFSTINYFQLIKFFAFFVIVASFQSCKKDAEVVVAPPSPGTLISYDYIKTFDLAELDEIGNSKLTSFLAGTKMSIPSYSARFQNPKFPVKVYRVAYNSVIPESGNTPVVAYGLIAIPESGTDTMPMISYQHGTVFSKYWAPSYLDSSMETELMIAQFASQGYILIAADYFGVGPKSTVSNTYFVRYSTEQACLDMYKASREVLQKEKLISNKFFVNGWSQGGYNTMLFLRRLELEKIKVNAAFTAAAPVDPLMFVTRGLFNPRPIDAFYSAGALCNLMFSIEKYNNLEGITRKYIRSDYYEPAKKLYNYEIPFESFISKVPIALDKVFTEEFFSDAKSANSPLFQILARSEAYKWFSSTPLRAYYGLLDEAVPDNIASLGVNYMKALGKTDAEAFNAGQEADHRATYIESILDAKAWIDSF
jgi:pimeloyl-ACP methyl ester carboxylesterase